MKKIYQLKTVLDIVITFSMLIMAVSLLGFVYAAMTGNPTKLKVNIGDGKIDHIGVALGAVLTFMTIGYGLFIYAIYQLKQLVNVFVRKEFFTDFSIKTLRLIGVSMLASSLLIMIPGYIYGALNSATIHLMMNTISPESMAFSIIISLFFIILSYIFNEAKIIKEDNELVI